MQDPAPNQVFERVKDRALLDRTDAEELLRLLQLLLKRVSKHRTSDVHACIRKTEAALEQMEYQELCKKMLIDTDPVFVERDEFNT